jgi:tetratricopeptide (TPR) repeat protein
LAVPGAARTRGSIAIAALVFAVYAWGACRTIYVGDSGELVAAVYVLGIPHPSGYPLYVILGKLWTLVVPVGSIAFRMSLFSAACGAVTAGLLHQLCLRAALRPMAATAAALAFAFAPSVWGEANVQRVYTLNAMFVAASTAVAFAWYRSGRPRALATAFFLCGLGATNHTFMVVYATALALFAAVHEPSLLRRHRQIAFCVAAFWAGLLPYVYLPLRSSMNPALDWGNPETWPAFLGVVTRRDFWNRRWLEGPGDLFPIAIDYARSLGHEFYWIGAFLALLGIVVGVRERHQPILLVALVMAGNLAAMASHGSRSDLFVWHRYYIPSFLMMAFLLALGLDSALARLPSRSQGVALLLPALALGLGWREFDRSRYRIAEDYSRTLLEALPPGASLVASDDNILFVLIYLRLVEGMRPDVDLILQGVGGSDLPPLRFNPDTHPLFFTHHPNWSVTGLDIVPMGLVFRTVRRGRAWPPAPALKDHLDGEDDPRVPQDFLTRNLVGEFHYMLGVTWESRAWPRAWREFQVAGEAAGQNDVLFYNIGLIYRRNGLFDEALEAFRRADAINPRRIASTSRAMAADRLREVVTQSARARALENAVAAKLTGLAPGTASYHAALAESLAAQGHALEARGHALRAAVLTATP